MSHPSELIIPSKIQEIKEAVELPLTHPELYEEIGIRPPKGVVLYGEPGAYNTMDHILNPSSILSYVPHF